MRMFPETGFPRAKSKQKNRWGKGRVGREEVVVTEFSSNLFSLCVFPQTQYFLYVKSGVEPPSFANSLDKSICHSPVRRNST